MRKCASKQEMVLGGLSIFRLAYLDASNCTLQFTALLFDSDYARVPVLISKQASLEVCYGRRSALLQTKTDRDLHSCRKPIKEFIDHIEKLTVKDISELVHTLMKKSPTVAALGDVSNVPRYAQIESRFK